MLKVQALQPILPKQDVHSEVPRLRLCERALHPALPKIHLQHRIAGRYQCCNVVGAMPDESYAKECELVRLLSMSRRRILNF